MVSIGGLLVIAGIGTRILSVLFIIELLVAVFLFKYGEDIGFIGAETAGAELEWALIAGFFALVGLGAGPFSGDAKFGIEEAIDKAI